MELSTKLGFASDAIGNQKNQDGLTLNVLLKCHLDTGASLDYLVYGEGKSKDELNNQITNVVNDLINDAIIPAFADEKEQDTFLLVLDDLIDRLTDICLGMDT